VERAKGTVFGVGKLVHKAVTLSPGSDDAGTVDSTNTDAVVFNVGVNWGSSWKWWWWESWFVSSSKWWWWESWFVAGADG